MSWWDTSNFTNLASQALKNAQKKIDKVLDISEEESQGKLTTQSDSSKTKGTTSDSWNAWLGSSTSKEDDSATAEQSSWSFPWGASSDSIAGTENLSTEVKEKTPEEIKSEVLKAAKERTQAKAKLFPDKKKKEKAKSLTEIKESHSVTKDQTESSVVVEEKPSDISTLKEHVETTGSGSEPKAIPEIAPNDDVSGITGDVPSISFDVEDSHAVSREFQPQDNVEDKLVLNSKAESMEIDRTVHSNHDQADAPAFQELSVSVDEQDLPGRSWSSGDLLTITGDTDTEQSCDATFQTVFESEGVSQIMKSSGSNSVDSQDIKVHDNDPDNSSDLPSNQLSGTDIQTADSLHMSSNSAADFSSSVEIVHDEDIPVIDSQAVIVEADGDSKYIDSEDKTETVEKNSGHVFCGEDVSVIKQGDSGQQGVDLKCSEDPLIIEKVESLEYTLESGDQLQAATSGLKEDKTEIHQSPPPSSGSESSLSKLDISMDTCTSEDTMVDEGSDQKAVLAEKECDETPVGKEESCDTDIQEGRSDDMNQEPTEEAQGKDDELNDKMCISHTRAVADEKVELSPANSFVKCMLEDAMEDGKLDSDSHSGGEKSEGSRSIHSGHDSSDEIDTTTSSDIEIISLPTPNGENRQVSPVDPIPLRIALQKTSWRGSPTHRRTDSQSSSSTNSKDGAMEQQLSPGRDSLDYTEWRLNQEQLEYSKQRMTELPALNEEDDNPYHPQRLLKKLAEMSEILEARESKLLQMSKENCDLMETNNILRNQLKQSEEAREAEMTDLNELTTEFTNRLTEAEKRISAVIKEKDGVKKQLQDAHAEIAKRAADVTLKNLLAEKEEQIKELLAEGEKLSKSQLQSNNIIKKLRAKEKDNESTLTSQKKKLEGQTEELDHLHKVLESKEELEKKQTEAVTQLTTAVQKQEKEIVRLKSDLEDATEKVRGLQTALDNSYKEMTELHRTNAVQDSKAHEAALSAEMQVREELKMELEKQQQQHKWEKDSLIMQIEDFRLSIARMEKDHNRREDMLRQEIGDLQKQLQEDEARNQDLTQSVSSATRPLLRQIENLQSTYAMQSGTWEKVEKNLTDRLGEAQNQLAVAVEKERSASEQMMEYSTKLSSLEAQTTLLKQDKSQLTAQLEMLKAKIELSEDAKQTEAAQIEMLKAQMIQEVTELKKEKVLLETQLDMERAKVEQEKKKLSLSLEQIRDLERELQRARSRGTPSRGNTPSPLSISRQDSMTNSFHDQSFTAITQEELDRSFILTSSNGNKQSLYDALRQSGAANLLENLQSQLKLREGEIHHLQSEIFSLERTRESMAKELVDLANKNEELERRVEDLPEIQKLHQELDQRYNALLQMYGEKVEETNELRLDLQDVKDMYKAQINHLLGQ